MSIAAFFHMAGLALNIVIESVNARQPPPYVPKKSHPPKSLWIKLFLKAMGWYFTTLEKVSSRIKNPTEVLTICPQKHWTSQHMQNVPMQPQQLRIMPRVTAHAVMSCMHHMAHAHRQASHPMRMWHARNYLWTRHSCQPNYI